MRPFPPLAIAIVMLVSSAYAQGWSTAAIAPTGGTASGQVVSNFAPTVNASNSLPVGAALLPGTFLAANATMGSSFGRCHAEWAPSFPGQTAASGLRIFTTASVSVQPPAGPNTVGAAGTLDTRLRIFVQAPNPSSGRLVLTWAGHQSESSVHTATMAVDLGADGTIESTFSTNWFNSGSVPARSVDLPMVIGTNAVPIEIQIGSYCSWSATYPTFNSQTVSLELTAQYFPGQAAVTWLDGTGATVGLWAFHGLDDSLVLALPNPGVVAIVFGAQAMVAPLVAFPLATQLVSFDAFVLGPNVTFTMPPLPPGTRIFAQGFVSEPSGTLRSSNSVQAFWP